MSLDTLIREPISNAATKIEFNTLGSNHFPNFLLHRWTLIRYINIKHHSENYFYHIRSQYGLIDSSSSSCLPRGATWLELKPWRSSVLADLFITFCLSATPYRCTMMFSESRYFSHRLSFFSIQWNIIDFNWKYTVDPWSV